MSNFVTVGRIWIDSSHEVLVGVRADLGRVSVQVPKHCELTPVAAAELAELLAQAARAAGSIHEAHQEYKTALAKAAEQFSQAAAEATAEIKG